MAAATNAAVFAQVHCQCSTPLSGAARPVGPPGRFAQRRAALDADRLARRRPAARRQRIAECARGA
eukprot:1462017-Lingulodinium_polyedra.AAC.1